VFFRILRAPAETTGNNRQQLPDVLMVVVQFEGLGLEATSVDIVLLIALRNLELYWGYHTFGQCREILHVHHSLQALVGYALMRMH